MAGRGFRSGLRGSWPGLTERVGRDEQQGRGSGRRRWLGESAAEEPMVRIKRRRFRGPVSMLG